MPKHMPHYLPLLSFTIFTTKDKIEHTAITVVPIAVMIGEMSYTIIFTYLSKQWVVLPYKLLFFCCSRI